MYVLDTNVLSELRKVNSGKADNNVVNWAKKNDTALFFTTSINIMELELGVLQKEKRDPIQGKILRGWLNEIVLPAFQYKVLSYGLEQTLRCAQYFLPNPKSYRDAEIAAITATHNMTLVTRNTKDFTEIDLNVLNPWL